MTIRHAHFGHQSVMPLFRQNLQKPYSGVTQSNRVDVTSWHTSGNQVSEPQPRVKFGGAASRRLLMIPVLALLSMTAACASGGRFAHLKPEVEMGAFKKTNADALRDGFQNSLATHINQFQTVVPYTIDFQVVPPPPNFTHAVSAADSAKAIEFSQDWGDDLNAFAFDQFVRALENVLGQGSWLQYPVNDRSYPRSGGTRKVVGEALLETLRWENDGVGGPETFSGSMVLDFNRLFGILEQRHRDSWASFLDRRFGIQFSSTQGRTNMLDLTNALTHIYDVIGAYGIRTATNANNAMGFVNGALAGEFELSPGLAQRYRKLTGRD